MNIKKWLAVAVCFVLAIVITAWITSNHSGAPAASTDAAARSWLFSLSSDSGSMKPNANGTYLLTLNGADDSITAFTDRPDRDSAVASIARAVEVWPMVFADAAPNAVLVIHDPKGSSDSFVVELTDPHLIGASTLTFQAKVLTADVMTPSSKQLAKSLYVTPPASFNAVSMFIDDVSTTTVNIPAKSVCVDKTGAQINPPGSVNTSAETGSFDAACQSAGGTVENTPGTHATYP